MHKIDLLQDSTIEKHIIKLIISRHIHVNIWWKNEGLLQEFSNESAIKIVAAKSYTSSSLKRTAQKGAGYNGGQHCLIA